MKSLFPSFVQLTGKVMDMRLERQNVVMSNLANIRTPGYRPLRLEFESELQAALGRDARGKMSRTQGDHLPSVFNANGFGPEFERAFQPHHEHGQDEVDLDKEVGIMSKNSMMYNALATVVKKEASELSKVIQEGQK